MKPVAHSTVGGARTDLRSKDKDDKALSTKDARPTMFDKPQSEDQGTRKGRKDEDPLLAALKRNYAHREAPTPEYGIFYHPTGASWRHQS